MVNRWWEQKRIITKRVLVKKNVYSVFHKKKYYKKSSPEPEKKIKNNVQVVCDKQKLDIIGMICVGKHPRPPQDLIFSRFFENMTIALKSRPWCRPLWIFRLANQIAVFLQSITKIIIMRWDEAALSFSNLNS